MKPGSATGGVFEKLFREYFRPLVVYALQYVKEEGIAEDIVQDVFLYIYEKKDSFPVHGHKRYFLYNLVRNRCLNRLEYQKIRKENNPVLHTLFNNSPEDPFELVSVIEFEHRYLQTVENLSPKCRQVFEMSRFEGRKNQEIADELGMSKRTVETHITQALKILRKRLRRYLPLGFLFWFSEIFYPTCEWVFNCF
ncbi:MAG: RNA polymerase sigma-70 factor [Bacteroidota bacterium]